VVWWFVFLDLTVSNAIADRASSRPRRLPAAPLSCYNESMDKPTLSNAAAGRIEIRMLDDSDAPALFSLAMAQGHDLDGFAWRKSLLTEADELGFIAWARQAEARFNAFCRLITLDGAPCGCASLYRPHLGAFPEAHAPSLQMGYWVGRFARGQGAGAQAMALLMAEIAPLLDPNSTVGIRTRSKNAASLSCGRKLGLSFVGAELPSMFDPLDVDVLLSGPLSPQPIASARVGSAKNRTL
jgi:RimJ/RimL family protein N-acetyltransferase